MPTVPNTLWGALAVAVGLFSKEFFSFLAKRARSKRQADLPPPPPPQYTPEDSWRDYCKEKFEFLTDHARDTSEVIHRLDKSHAVMASQLKRIEIDHQNICTGKGPKNVSRN